MHTMLIDVLDDGERLEMEDGSIWEVSPGDWSIVCTWTPTAPIDISKSNDETYPYSLRNGRAVAKARRVKKSTAAR